jgi:hypothetical protein
LDDLVGDLNVRGIDDFKKKQGLLTSDIEELALDGEYDKTTLTRQSS